jgi:hypothetical protein
LGTEFESCVGDFPLTLEKVLSLRIRSEPSKATVGDINRILDGLTRDIRGKGKKSNHDWRDSQQSQSQGLPAGKAKRGRNNSKGPNRNKIRAKWIQKAFDEYKLSPLEHKWLARIMLDEIKIGIGWETILSKKIISRM